MVKVYVVEQGDLTVPMQSVKVKNEDKELQTLLLHNADLLPGDQIDPDDPCRWMLIRREMLVPDPVTGVGRWNIDFLFVDHNAVPTFVECKRYLDTRSRRQVVGQVLEYAANAQFYWTAADLRSQGDAAVELEHESLEKRFSAFQQNVAETLDDFLGLVEKNLRASKLRILFFLEQAPSELKRLVEFMNAQMADVEVLLVEARQFAHGPTRVVVPTLYGFTERIRQVKRALASTTGEKKPLVFDWDSFASNAMQHGVSGEGLAAIRSVYDGCDSLDAEIVWGRGVHLGSFTPRWPALSPKVGPFSIYANGKLEWHFGSPEIPERFFEALLANWEEPGGVISPDARGRYLTMPLEVWKPKAKDLCAVLGRALATVND